MAPESAPVGKTRPVDDGMSGEDAAEFARFVVAEVDRSGYGTPKPDRFMPTFDPLRLRGLAEAYLSLIGRDADAPNGSTPGGSDG